MEFVIGLTCLKLKQDYIMYVTKFTDKINRNGE